MKEVLKKLLRKLGFLDPAFSIYWAAQPRVIAHNILYQVQGAPDGLPIPPLKLRSKVWGEYADISLFLGQTGQIQFLLDTLAECGAHVNEFQAILDFGCGAGRAIRQFPFLNTPLKKAKIFGSDINQEQIQWCRRNLPFAEFEINSPQPPLNYADKEFDLVYTFSVFTHLPESYQRAWIKELARVLKPGGFLLITTCGESYLETMTHDEQERFRDGQLVVRHGEMADKPLTYNECIAFHPPGYLERNLATGFELLRFLPGDSSWYGPRADMDHYFLKKREDD